MKKEDLKAMLARFIEKKEKEHTEILETNDLRSLIAYYLDDSCAELKGEIGQKIRTLILETSDMKLLAICRKPLLLSGNMLQSVDTRMFKLLEGMTLDSIPDRFEWILEHSNELPLGIQHLLHKKVEEFQKTLS